MAFQAGSKTDSGYLALPPSGSGPGVLVLHAWWGLNDFFVALCDRLAREGFVALAPDLYAGAVAASIEEAETLRDAHEGDFEATQNKVLHALDCLRQQPALQGRKVGAVGFSLGAYWSLLLSTLRPEDIAAAVLFYGVGEGDFTSSRAAYLGHFAENDDWEPLDQVRAMEAGLRAAGRDVTVHVYPGAGHWFFEENRPDAYHGESAQLAWNRTVSFLRDRLYPHPEA
jgi:carboxymethylenebutenolidase